VEAAFEGDDLERAAFVQFAVFARELDRALIGFRAGIGKNTRSKQELSTSAFASFRLVAL